MVFHSVFIRWNEISGDSYQRPNLHLRQFRSNLVADKRAL